MKRVLKWNVPVDDRRHEIGAGRVVHVECQHGIYDLIQVWTEEPVGEVKMIDAQVYGTGHLYPDEGETVGSVVTFGGKMVWHVVVFKETIK